MPAIATAADLISHRVVVGSLEERLADLAPKIKAAEAHHCAVVDGARKFLGLVRLADVAGHTHAGNRILGDLISSIQPLVARSSEPADAVTALFSKHRLYEAVILTDTGDYVGLATAESVIEFALEEFKRKDQTLQQTQARLEAASSAKDIFLRSLSHELRTPLNPVLLLAGEGAANPDLPQEVREQFEVIAANALLEAHLIDGLLDLTRASKDTIRLDLRLIDVNDVLHQAIEDVQLQASASGAIFQVEAGSEKNEIMGDAAKLAQAFRNLLRNALAATERSGRVHVTSRCDLETAKTIITISDNGRGMTEAEVGRAFEPFPQDRPAGSEGAGKMALGLTLARAIVSLHSGSIEAKSEGLGCGASFKIELPLTQSSAAPAVPA